MDGGRRVAPTVVTVETVETLPPGGSFNLWSGAGARHPSREEAVLFYALVNVSNGVSEAWLNALLRGQVFSEGAPIGIVGLRDGEPFRHRPVTFLPRGAIRALAGVWTWNRCGLFAPVAAAAEDLPRCPACDEYKDQPFGKEWPNFLLALETLMDWSSSADPLVRIANEAALVECASDETSARFNHARHAAVAGLDLLRSESAESNGVTLAVLAIVMSGFCGGGVEWLYDIHQSLAEIYSRSPGRFEVKDLRAMQILAQAWNSYGDVEHEQVQIRLTRLRESVGDALYFPFAVSDGIQQLAEISPQLFPPDGEYG